MLKTGDNLYLRFMDDMNPRILQKSTLIGIDPLGLMIEVECSDSRLEPGVELLMYHEVDGRFSQQIARIDRVGRDGEMPLVQLVTTGDPFDAEEREHPRASTSRTDVVFAIEGEGCRLLDVSPVGFAVTSQQSYGAGQLVTVSFDYDGMKYCGRARVRSFSQMSDTNDAAERCTRYGMLCESAAVGETLAEGLLAMSDMLSSMEVP